MLPLQLSLKPSALLTYLIIVAWLALQGLLLFAGVNLWLCAAFAVFSALLYWRWLVIYAWLQAPRSLASIKVTGSGWHLRLRDGSITSAYPAPGCRFIPGLIVLRLRQLDGRIYWWPLLADSGETQQLRRLRMAGRWGPKFNSIDS